jgi:hypothetical protein
MEPAVWQLSVSVRKRPLAFGTWRRCPGHASRTQRGGSDALRDTPARGVDRAGDPEGTVLLMFTALLASAVMAMSPAAAQARAAPSGVHGGALFGGTQRLIAAQGALHRSLAVLRDYYTYGESFPDAAARHVMAEGGTVLASLDGGPSRVQGWQAGVRGRVGQPGRRPAGAVHPGHASIRHRPPRDRGGQLLRCLGAGARAAPRIKRSPVGGQARGRVRVNWVPSPGGLATSSCP